MVDLFIWVALIVYGVCTAFLLSLSLVQLHLTFHSRRARLTELKPGPDQRLLPEAAPPVTVQLPVYNERYVVERLLEAVVKLDYPRDKLEIQVLDDSTDETAEIVAALVARYRQCGVQIHHLHRANRAGFKAGALAAGAKQAHGRFIAIFDADFVPRPLFLQKTIPLFADPGIGAVQTRWEHLNRNHSALTRSLAIAIDSHFIVEHSGRAHADLCINFNGTAGVWRKECIEDAGGWQDDTLAEDLDLSYRAQLRGWKFAYLVDVTSPSELPIMMDAIRTQQYRWTKGAAECTRKNMPSILKSPKLTRLKKTHAFFHHTNNASHVCMLVLALLSFPMLVIQHDYGQLSSWQIISSAYGFSFFFLAFFHWTSYSYANRHRTRRMPLRFLLEFPVFMIMFMGLSFHNARAVLEGYLGHRTAFVRTPKFNARERKQGRKYNAYVRRALNPQALSELILAAIFLGGVALGIHFQFWGFVPFHSMLAVGLSFVGLTSLFHSIVE